MMTSHVVYLHCTGVAHDLAIPIWREQRKRKNLGRVKRKEKKKMEKLNRQPISVRVNLCCASLGGASRHACPGISSIVHSTCHRVRYWYRYEFTDCDDNESIFLESHCNEEYLQIQNYMRHFGYRDGKRLVKKEQKQRRIDI